MFRSRVRIRVWLPSGYTDVDCTVYCEETNTCVEMTIDPRGVNLTDPLYQVHGSVSVEGVPIERHEERSQ